MQNLGMLMQNSLDLGQEDSVSAAAFVDLLDNPSITRLVHFEFLAFAPDHASPCYHGFITSIKLREQAAW